MIREHKIVVRGVCDACGKNLSSEDQTNDDGTPSSVHYGVLRSHFGWGSHLDGEESYDLCEACWTKVLEALRIPLHRNIGTTPLYMTEDAYGIKDLKPLKGRRNVEIFPMPVWHCYFCNFTLMGRHSMPEHSCAKWKALMRRCRRICPVCKSGGLGWPNLRHIPVPKAPGSSELRWCHHAPNQWPPVPCGAHGALEKAMRRDFE